MKKIFVLLICLFLTGICFASKPVGDNLGNHKATKSVDINEHNVTNVLIIYVDSITANNHGHIQLMVATTFYGSSWYRGHDIKGVDNIDAQSFTTDGVPIAAGYTTYYFVLGGFQADIYESKTNPIDVFPIPTDAIEITGIQAFTTFCSTAASVIFEIKESTGCHVPTWTSISTIELSTNSACSSWTTLQTSVSNSDCDKIGLFVDFVSAIGGDLQVGAGVLVRYWRSE